MFWEVVGLQRGTLSLVSTTEELRGRKNSGPGLEKREYGHRERWQRDTPLSEKVGTNFVYKRRSLCIFRSQTQATESNRLTQHFPSLSLPLHVSVSSDHRQVFVVAFIYALCLTGSDEEDDAH
jgi:hypothetical protein